MNKLARMLGYGGLAPVDIGNALMRPAGSTQDINNQLSQIPVQRGGVFPLTTYADNSTRFDSEAGVIGALAKALTAPARAYKDGMTRDEMIDEGMNFATTLGMGGLAIPKPANSVGMFGGRGVVPRPAMPIAREGAGSISGGFPTLPPERLRFAESHAMDDFGNKLTELFTGRKPTYQGKGWSLSANKASGPEFEYTIMQDGKPVASARGFVRGDQAEIEWIGRNRIEDKADLGVAGTRSLMDQLKRDFPDVKQFSGTRVSGARKANRSAPRQTLRREDGWF